MEQKQELEKLSIVASETDNAVLICDSEGRFEWVNKGFERLYGLSFEEFTHQHKTIYETSSNPDFKEVVKEAVKNNSSITYNSHFKKPTGETVWLQTTLTPIFEQEPTLAPLTPRRGELPPATVSQRGELTTHEQEETNIDNYSGERIFGYQTANREIYKVLKERAEEMRKNPTEAESVLWNFLKGNYSGFHFRRQHIVDRFIVDFICLRKKLIIEVDGNIHDQQKEEDAQRTFILNDRGFTVIRFRNEEVLTNPEFVVDKIKEQLAQIDIPQFNFNEKDASAVAVPPSGGSGGRGWLKKLVLIESDITKIKEAEEELREIHQEITDSINYAKRIQNAILPDPALLNEHFAGHFILFKPRDVVSGDFYWFTEVEKQIVVTVADCTGHGVPGAFMSMLGISFLREIVQKEYMTEPSRILHKLRKEIINALKQKGVSEEQKDGMDISLCSINTAALEMQWAGANNPCWILKNGEFTELTPDKMPIGIHEKMNKFTSHTIKLNKNDIIYLTGDGYKDQFGGPNNKKFMTKQLKELLVNNSNKTMNEQKEILDKTIENWKSHIDPVTLKPFEQTDDITLMGIKI